MVKYATVEAFGKRVATVNSLFDVERYVEPFRFATPLAVEAAARQLRLQRLGVDFQQVRRKGQNWKERIDALT